MQSTSPLLNHALRKYRHWRLKPFAVRYESPYILELIDTTPKSNFYFIVRSYATDYVEGYLTEHVLLHITQKPHPSIGMEAFTYEANLHKLEELITRWCEQVNRYRYCFWGTKPSVTASATSIKKRAWFPRTKQGVSVVHVAGVRVLRPLASGSALQAWGPRRFLGAVIRGLRTLG